MKLFIEALFDGVDEAWIKEYVEDVFRGDIFGPRCKKELYDTGTTTICARDPANPQIIGATTYRIERDEVKHDG